jgi:Ca2+-binding EF-hand superfamily protein
LLGEQNTSNELWNGILQEVDSDGNGEIDLKEFTKMMLSKL